MNSPATGNTSHDVDAPRKVGRQGNLAADLGSCHGGIMRIGRAIIIPAILALSMAGSVLAAAEMSAAAEHAPSVHVQETASSAGALVHYHD